MNIKTLSKFCSGVAAALLVFGLFSSVSVHAATRAPAPTTQPATVLATVNIQNAAITAQHDHALSISFDFTNRVGIQPHVRYSVQLINPNSKTQYIADEYVYSDEVYLGENATVHKNIAYTAPASAQGTYEVYLQSKTDTGFPLAIANVGQVTFAAGASGVELVASSCNLQIQGVKNVYTLLQGVDIKPTETLTLSCSAANHSSNPVTLTPTYETHYRSPYGNVVAASGGDTTSFILQANETKTVTLTLPKAADAQAYDVLVSLAGTQTSNVVDAHYVIQGSSATIQTITLDKDYYALGSNALASFLWAPSADGFSGSRAGSSTPSATKLSISLESGSVACVTPVTSALPENMQVHITLAVTHNCTNPHLVVHLIAANGSILASGELTRNTPSSIPWVPVVSVIVLLVVLVAGGFYFTKHRTHKHV